TLFFDRNRDNRNLPLMRGLKKHARSGGEQSDLMAARQHALRFGKDADLLAAATGGAFGVEDTQAFGAHLSARAPKAGRGFRPGSAIAALARRHTRPRRG